MSEVIPIFVSNYTIGRSILHCEKPEDEINENKPISIFSIAKKHKLENVYIKDASFTGFIEQFEISKECEIPLRFGYQVCACANSSDKTDKSRETESKIVIWLNNSNSYKSAIKIASKAAVDGFYYHPRISWTDLHSLWNENLSLSIDFYDGFIAKNLLTYKSRCVPDFGKIRPTFFIEPLHNLPFDDLITEATLNYCKNNNYDILNTHTCHYYKESDIKQFQVFRCISERTTLNKPNLSFFSSNKFAFETWLKHKSTIYV